MIDQLAARYHRHKSSKALNGFAFDITVRYNDHADKVIVSDLNNGDTRHVFDTAEAADKFIVDQVEREMHE